MSEQSQLPNASDINRLLQKNPPRAPTLDPYAETLHTDDGREISYKLEYSVTFKLGTGYPEARAWTLFTTVAKSAEHWAARELAKRPGPYASDQMKPPVGEMNMDVRHKLSNTNKVVASQPFFSIVYDGSIDIIRNDLEKLKASVFADLCSLYESIVCDVGSIAATIYVGDEAWKASMTENVPTFTKPQFGVTAITGPSDS